MNNDKIICDQHGNASQRAMRIHLCASTGLKYIESPASKDDHAWAWCEQCNDIISNLSPDDEVNLSHLFKLICHFCYEKHKNENTFLEWAEE